MLKFILNILDSTELISFFLWMFDLTEKELKNQSYFKFFKNPTSHYLTGPIAPTVIDPAAIWVRPASLMLQWFINF